MRRALAAGLLWLLLTVGVAPAAADDFVAYQGDVGRSGSRPVADVVPPLAQRWAIELPLPLTNTTPAQPRIAKGRVFVTEGQWGGPSWLYALDLETGHTLWGPVSVGGTGYWADSAYDGGRVFVQSDSGDI